MQVIDSKIALTQWRSQRPHDSQRHKSGITTLALVPTMGNLHSGHLSLVETAKQHADQVMVSIYVNPSQFGVNEDWQRYPRTLSADLQLLEQAGVDWVWLPDDALLYPYGLSTMSRLLVPALENILCGQFRPGHFSGVATVVSKLFNWVQPDCAVFGEKDYQQVLVIARMCDEMGYPLQLLAVPTARAADGLAMSSRNQYLSTDERQIAPELFKTMWSCRQRIVSGEIPMNQYAQLCQQSMTYLTQNGFVVDYFEIRRQQDLDLPQSPQDDCIILTAARLGRTRLIDNLKV